MPSAVPLAIEDLLELDPDVAAELAESLPEDERDELLELLENAAGGEALADFIARVCPGEAPPRHLRPIIAAIERARLIPLRLCISLPPGHAKTTTILRAIVWWLLRFPADTCAYVTFSQEQARAKSRVCRALARDVAIEVVADADSLGEWRTRNGGGLLAKSAKNLNSVRVSGLMIYDDPYANRQECDSPPIREAIWERFKSVVMTRLMGGSVIVCHTRWHEDDLIGRLTKPIADGGYGWELINIPAVAENDNDVLGRKKGEAAWPEQYPIERCRGSCGHAAHLDEVRTMQGGPNGWSWLALFQGRPLPMTGGLFKREQFHILEVRPEGGRRVRAWDFAATKNATSDYTAGALVSLVPKGEGIGERLVIEDLVHDRWTPGEVDDQLKATADLDGPGVPIDIPQDPAAAGIANVTHIAGLLHGYDLRHSRELGKPASWRSVISQAQAGNLFLVRASWNNKLIDELCSLPAGSHDDIADAIARGYASLLANPEAENDDGWGGGAEVLGGSNSRH